MKNNADNFIAFGPFAFSPQRIKLIDPNNTYYTNLRKTFIDREIANYLIELANYATKYNKNVKFTLNNIIYNNSNEFWVVLTLSIENVPEIELYDISPELVNILYSNGKLEDINNIGLAYSAGKSIMKFYSGLSDAIKLNLDVL